MATSTYFNNYGASAEQTLYEDLFIESIKIYGYDAYYAPRTLKNYDELYGEDQVSEFNNAYSVEMYIKSVDGFEGDGIFLSKFGLEIRDQIVFTVADRSFSNEIGSRSNLSRPREGDLIQFDLSPNRPQVYQIQYVNDRTPFYQLGGFRGWDLTCEAFEYSGEELNTGLAIIDNLQKDHSVEMSNEAILSNNGEIITTNSGLDLILNSWDFDTQNQDWFADNDEIQTESDELLDWTEIDPFSEGNI